MSGDRITTGAFKMKKVDTIARHRQVRRRATARCADDPPHSRCRTGRWDWNLGFDGLRPVEGVVASGRRRQDDDLSAAARAPSWSVVVDAVLDEVNRTAPVECRATARESFEVSMRLVAKSFRGHHGKIPANTADPGGPRSMKRIAHKTLADRWLLARRKISREIVRRGIASVPNSRESLDPDVVIDALYGPLYHRLLLPYDGDATRLSDAYIDALIDTVFGGLERK